MMDTNFPEYFNESDPEPEDEWGYLPGIDPSVHYIVGGILTIIGSMGIVGNALVLIVFTRFRRLRGPFSAFIVNLAVADLCTSLLHVMVIVSSFSRRWLFGHLGCQLYAGGVGHFGLLSIVTLAAISVERYMVITSKPLSKSWKITQYSSKNVCLLCWFYCLAMSVPPLIGWSRYDLEGFHTSCSWDYTTTSTSNRLYYVYLLVLGFVLPVTIILYCYAFIMATILAHSRSTAPAKANGGITLQANVASRDHIPEVGHPLSSSFRTAEIIMVLVILFLISWTPYAVVTLIAQFGDQRLVTPWVSALPAIFAKASVVYNPIVYGLSHPHFRTAVKQYLLHCVMGESVTTLGASHQHYSLGRLRSERQIASTPGSFRRHSQVCSKKFSGVEPDCHSEPAPAPCCFTCWSETCCSHPPSALTKGAPCEFHISASGQHTLVKCSSLFDPPHEILGIHPSQRRQFCLRMKSMAVKHADMEATWLPSSGKVKSGLASSKRHPRTKNHSTAITSEGFDTMDTPSTAPPVQASLDKSKSKTRSWLNIGKR